MAANICFRCTIKDSGAHNISHFTRISWLPSYQCFNHIPEEMVLPGRVYHLLPISDWKFALLTAGMRVSCGWQSIFEYLFCCKQRPSKFRKTRFFKSVKATSCSSNAASNTFQLDSKLQALPHYSVLSSQWIVNWTIWYMFTRCSNKEWQTRELWIPSNQEKPAHLCLEPIPACSCIFGAH